MKTCCAFLIAFSMSSALASNDRIVLDCNTPMGSGNQQFTIFSSNDQYFVKELNMNGRWTKPVSILAESWKSGEVSWTSEKDGSVKLTRVRGGWHYVADGIYGYADCY